MCQIGLESISVSGPSGLYHSSMKEGIVLFNDTLNTLFALAWHQTYGKGPLSKRAARDLL